MFRVSAAAEPLVESIRGVFNRPTFERFLTLMCGLIVTMGRRTVSRALRTMEPRLRGHWCNYHRIYSQAHFSMWKLAAALTRQAVAILPAKDPIILVVDDTVQQKQGDRVWAKGAHRDARNSTRSRTSIKFGHKWLVLCILATLPGINRPWALPILCGLCRPQKTAGQIGHADPSRPLHSGEPDVEGTVPDPQSERSAATMESNAMLSQTPHDLRRRVILGASGSVDREPAATSCGKGTSHTVASIATAARSIHDHLASGRSGLIPKLQKSRSRNVPFFGSASRCW